MSREPGLVQDLLRGDDGEASLVDLVDHLLDKGCVLQGELIIGIADIDLIYVELAALLCSVDRIEAKRP